MAYFDQDHVWERAWKLLFSEVSDDMKEVMRNALARAFEEEFQASKEEKVTS